MDVLLDIIQTFDYDLVLHISETMRGGASDAFWKALSLLGNYGILWIALAVLLLFFRKTRRAGIAMLAALALGLLVGNVLIKNWVMRPRPFVTHPNLVPLLDPGDQWSFPSAHTLSAFAASTALLFHWKLGGLLAYIPAALIAFSRLYACVHYPTDVLAGLILGVLCGLLAAWVTDRLIDRAHTLRLRKGA